MHSDTLEKSPPSANFLFSITTNTDTADICNSTQTVCVVLRSSVPRNWTIEAQNLSIWDAALC